MARRRAPARRRVSAPSGIGGVMPALPAGPPVHGSLLDLWLGPDGRLSAFATARAALAALLRSRDVRRAWLPAYACDSLALGAAACGAEVDFYALDRQLRPDVEALAKALAPGDAVIVVDHFGCALVEAWRPLRARFADILWIEDRAQALDTGQPPLGETRLFSPRKLAGVADGGLLVGDTPPPMPQGAADESVWAPEEARASDPKGRHPERWFPQHQARESAFTAAPAPATARTMAALRSLPAAPVAARRRANWRRLADLLPGFALWPLTDPAFAPLAFPIVVEDAGAAQAALAEERIWSPRHWASLPSDPDRFPDCHWLAARCLSLPCDQRYGEVEMVRIADAVRRRLRTPQPR